jgi:hypothetical protein
MGVRLICCALAAAVVSRRLATSSLDAVFMVFSPGE